MKEETEFKIGDTVILNEKGRSVVRNIHHDTVFTITSLSEDGLICTCSFDEGLKYIDLKYIDLYCSNVKHYKTFTNPMQVTREQVFELLTNQMLETFKKKNADYGNSTTQTFEEFGLTSYAVRLSDKLNRIKTFCKKGEFEVEEESVMDTLLDMSNYCLLAIIDIKNKNKK